MSATKEERMRGTKGTCGLAAQRGESKARRFFGCVGQTKTLDMADMAQVLYSTLTGTGPF